MACRMRHRERDGKEPIFGAFKCKNSAQSTLTNYSINFDIGFPWRLAASTADNHETVRRDGRLYLWLDYMGKVVSFVVTRYPAAVTIILVYDIYNKP